MKAARHIPVIEMQPDGYYSTQDIDKLIEAIERRVHAREVMRIEDALTFLNVTRSTLSRMVQAGLPYHAVPGLGGKVFLRSELIDYIKTN